MNKICGFLCCAGLVTFLFSASALKEKPIKGIRESAAAMMNITQWLKPFAKEEQGVIITAKAYNSVESKQFLGSDLADGGLQPVQLTIQNNSANFYTLSPEAVTLPSVSYKTAASKVARKAIPRSIAFKVAGFFFWPFMIPGTIDSIVTMHANSVRKKDFSAKSIRQEHIVPYSTIHRILFVPMAQFQKYFSVSLLDQDKNQEVTFNATVS